MRTQTILMIVAVAIVAALAVGLHLFGGEFARTIHGR
jgi:hypothetical protein